MKLKWFWVVFVDDDEKTFNVGSPSTDDTEATTRTVHLQKSGRGVRIVTTAPVQTREELPSHESVIAAGVSDYEHDPGLRW